MPHTVNLGILAHVDAGKTSLTERLLHLAGVVDQPGRVDDGNTRTDSLALERRRGITIKSAVVSFALHGVTVNLIDTPGHPDFIAEVERVLGVLDGAVLVVSAVEGVQAQTRILHRTLTRLRIPTLIMINKIDRRGADVAGVLREIAEKLTPAIVPMAEVTGAGTRAAMIATRSTISGSEPRFRHPRSPEPDSPTVLSVLAEHDEALLAAYVEGRSVSPEQRRRALRVQTGRALVHPVFLGSAITGAGVEHLAEGIATLLPRAPRDLDAPAAGTVFKVERGRAGERIAYVRMFAGTVRLRDRIAAGVAVDSHRDAEQSAGAPRHRAATNHGSVHEAPMDPRTTSPVAADRAESDRAESDRAESDRAESDRGRTSRGHTDLGQADRVTRLDVFADGELVRRQAVVAGEIAQVRGLTHVRIGDAIGPAARPAHHFPPPTLESVVVPEHGEDRAALFVALTELAEQDPLIDLRRDEADGDSAIAVSLYGEVQKEVIAATLAEEYGISVRFRETTTVCVERVTGVGEAVESIGVAENPYFATVGLRVEPGEEGFALAVEVGAMPAAFFTAVREAVTATLRHGSRGWRLVDCAVTMTHAGFCAPVSTARDFRHLTPLVLVEALRRAGPTVCEPVHAFRLEIPADALDAVLPALVREDGVAQAHVVRGPLAVLDGDIPAAKVHGLRRVLPGLTRGEAVLESWFDHYRPVRGTPPTRARPPVDPWRRKEYLLQVDRRVGVR